MSYKIAFIGGAVDSVIGRSHYAALAMDGLWTLVAGAFSRDIKRNHKTAEAFNVPASRCYEDWRVLLQQEKDKLDAVAILSPSPMHADMVCEALALGLPVICEKPLATNVADIERIMALAKKQDGLVMTTFNYNANSMVRELRARILQGELGELWHMQLEMPQSWLAKAQEINSNQALAWRVDEGFIFRG